ncbi:MAG: hypothetical protein HYY40_01440 [Bacteroidetes bacterium]|nr:hypothetical protein [Bacteroidota bacterium]
MKTLTTVSLLLLIAFSFLSYLAGPPAGTTNAPSETTCSTNQFCHGGFPDTGTGFAEITLMGGIPAAGYVPGQTYSVMPFVEDDSFSVAGFQTVALLSNNSGAGSVTISNPIKTQLIISGSKEYVVHTSAGAQNPGMHDWMYDWTAPPKGSGTVIIYGAFVAADGDGSVNGDLIYTDSLILYEDTTTGFPENNPKFVTGFTWSPLSGRLTINTRVETPENFKARITGCDGRVILVHALEGSLPSHSINLSNLPDGIYFISVERGKGFRPEIFRLVML